MGTGEFNAGDNPAMDWHPIQGGVEILLHATETGVKRQPDGPPGLNADLTSPIQYCIGKRRLNQLLGLFSVTFKIAIKE